MMPLRTLLGDYPTTHALRSGRLTSSLVPLAFADVTVPNKAFKRVVRDLEFDVAELALMTFLMARSRGRRFDCCPSSSSAAILCPFSSAIAIVASPRRISPIAASVFARIRRPRPSGCVRSSPISSASSSDRAEWVTLEEGHVADVADPPTVRPAPSGADLMTMLRDRVVDAVIVDPVPQIRDSFAWCPILTRPSSVAAHHGRAHAESRGRGPRFACRDAEVMRELFRLFRESREMGGTAVDPVSTPLGLEANRRNLEVAIAVADAQHLLAQPMTVDDLVTDHRLPRNRLTKELR